MMRLLTFCQRARYRDLFRGLFRGLFRALFRGLLSVFLCVVVLAVSWWPAHAWAYEVAIRHLPDGVYTTQVVIQANARQGGSVRVDIRFTDEKTGHQVLASRKSVDFGNAGNAGDAGQQRIRRLPFTLPEGRYTVLLSVDARPYAEVFTRAYTCHARTTRLIASDAVLSHQPVSDISQALPLFSPTVAFNQPALFWGMALRTGGYKGLTARIVLYRQNQDGKVAATYTSVQQTNRVLAAAAPTAPLSLTDRIDLSALAAGQYLLEILVYQDKALLLERTAPFEVAWRGYTRLFSDLSTAIAQMAYVFPKDACAALLALPGGQQKAAFMQAWRTRYGDRATAEMEAYYQKVFDAQARYTSWTSARAATYIRFGQPDRVLRENSREIWEYHKWQGRIAFP